MKHFFLLLFVLPVLALAQHPDKDLLGKVTFADLMSEPHQSWYTKNYTDYQPKPALVSELKKMNLTNCKVQIIFGSWCGDSKREVPRMTKLLDQISFPVAAIELIGVDDSTEVYKQSPQREEKDLLVYRVPTFIIYEKGKEIGRIVEYPAESLERDLLKIVGNKEYQANYFSYPIVKTWLQAGLLADENVSARGLAMQLYGKVQYESELNACGYVLLADGKTKEAITVFRINANLFPQSSNCFDSLGEAYAKANLTERAIQSFEQALKLNPENESAKRQLKTLKPD